MLEGDKYYGKNNKAGKGKKDNGREGYLNLK
jgi:hypothetical protein